MRNHFTPCHVGSIGSLSWLVGDLYVFLDIFQIQVPTKSGSIDPEREVKGTLGSSSYREGGPELNEKDLVATQTTVRSKTLIIMSVFK
jgi:hypothetical protein